MNTETIDVLAVMKDLQNAAADYDGEKLQGIAAGDVFEEARAAVAELIEAATVIRNLLNSDGDDASNYFYAEPGTYKDATRIHRRNILNNALAAVGGAK